MGDQSDSERSYQTPTEDGESQGYVCDACGEAFETEDDLRRHLFAVGMVE